MQYFVTGATGFIGRQLLPLLLRREGEIALLVRPGSMARFGALRERLDPGGSRLRAVAGDISQLGLGVSDADRDSLRGAHVFHLAAIYDLTAGEEESDRANIDGTRNCVALANAIGAACLHHTSSIAVAGRYSGRFTEAMFDEGQELDHPYFRTKHGAEAIVRAECTVPYRIYRPGMVIGSSETGEADRVDGPYYAFKLIQKMRDSFPQWMPFAGPEGESSTSSRSTSSPGRWTTSPTSPVATARSSTSSTRRRCQPRRHPQHLLPRRPRTRVRAALRPPHGQAGPQERARGARRAARRAAGAPPAARAASGVPEAALQYMDYPASFDCRQRHRGAERSGIACPPLHSYAWKVWDHWERHLDPELPTPAEPAPRPRREGGGDHRRVERHRPGRRAAGRRRRRHHRRSSSRGVEKLEEVRAEVEAAGGSAAVRPTDLSDVEACRGMVRRVLAEHGRVDVLVNNAGRSIRRAVLHSLDRFHDFERTMQLNYFGAIA